MMCAWRAAAETVGGVWLLRARRGNKASTSEALLGKEGEATARGGSRGVGSATGRNCGSFFRMGAALCPVPDQPEDELPVAAWRAATVLGCP